MTRFARPAVAVFDDIVPRHPAELLPGACKQMELLREQLPEADGGQLIVARVRPDGVTAGPIGELTPADDDADLPEPIPSSHLEEHA